MTSFYYNYQNPSVCCFLLQIRTIVLWSSAGLTNFNNKAKNEMNSGSCSQMSSSWKWPNFIINKKWERNEKTSKQTNTRFAVFDWKWGFFSPVWPTVHTYPVKTVTRNASFQKRSPVWRCLNVLLYSFGWIKQRFLKTITSQSWIPVNAHAPIKDRTVYRCMLTDKTNSKTQRVDAEFWKTEEKISKFKQNRIRVVGALEHWHKDFLTN